MKRVIMYHARKYPSLANKLLVIAAVGVVLICCMIVVRPAVSTVQRVQAVLASPGEQATLHNKITYPSLSDSVATPVKSYIDSRTQQFADTLDKTAFDPRNQLIIDGQIIYQDEQFVSVKITEQQLRAEQPTVVSTHMMTLDMTSGAEVSFVGLFADPSHAMPGAVLYDYVKMSRPSDMTTAQLFALLQLRPDQVGEYWLDHHKVGFTLPHIQKNVSVATSVWGDMLRPEFRTLDGSTSAAQPVEYVVDAVPSLADAIDPNGKLLALTFDDGPGPLTARVLDVLHQYRSHATFFVIGRSVAARADTIQRTINEGNEIGNHSWDHPYLTTLDAAGLRHQIHDTQTIIQQTAGGYTPALMRPPYGAFNDKVTDYLLSQHLDMALWNADTHDWDHQDDSQLIYDAIMGAASDGRVILLHDIHQSSVEAAERAIPELVKQGYQLVTMSQLQRFR